MYSFIRNMWILKKITADEVSIFVSKGLITAAEAKTIKAEKQVENG